MTKFFEPVGPDEDNKPLPLAPRLAWFMGIMVMSGALVAIMAYALKALLSL